MPRVNKKFRRCSICNKKTLHVREIRDTYRVLICTICDTQKKFVICSKFVKINIPDVEDNKETVMCDGYTETEYRLNGYQPDEAVVTDSDVSGTSGRYGCYIL